MSLNHAKASVILTVVIINHVKYLCTGQFFGTYPILRAPLMFNRRMLVYPNSFRTWPKSASTHCCSNANSDLISRYAFNRLNYFDTASTERMKSRFEYSRNFAQLDPLQITATMNRGSQLTSPWRDKQNPLDYNYWSGMKNRLLLRSHSNENLMKNSQNENDWKYTQHLYISTTEKLIKTETTEKYFVSVNPITSFVESESEEVNLQNSSKTEPSITTQLKEIQHDIPAAEIPEPTESDSDLLASIKPDEETSVSSFESLLGNSSLPKKKKLNKIETTLPDSKGENKTIPLLQNETFPNELTCRSKQNNDSHILEKFLLAFDDLERKFYLSTFTKLSTNSPVEKAENGISFVQSGLLLHLMLTALTTTVDRTTRAEIEACNNFPATEKEKINALRLAIEWLPTSDKELRFRWSSRLLLGPSMNVTTRFRAGTAAESRMLIDTLNTTSNPELLMNIFNHMIEVDSGGAMRNTFEEDDLSQGVISVLLSTMYVRGSWRSAPTLLDGSRPFYEAGNPPQLTRMIRINDVVKYADLKNLDAEAVEISYATPGLSLLVLVPRGRSLRALSRHVVAVGVRGLPAVMTSRRLAVSMPLYTLRMTLLLPNKLQDMGITNLVSSPDAITNTKDSDKLKVSHAVQRLMFWSEAGRNAFKDDGIEWDEAPEMEMVLDRPYLFFVRWRNVTLMNGHFVL